MVETTTGLVLRTRLLTETSLIVHWLTRDFGRLATVAKGARRPKSPFQGKLDLFYRAEFSFTRSRRSELHTLRELSLRETHPGLRRDLALLQQAVYCAALVEQTTETDTPLAELFELFNGLLDNLRSTGNSTTLIFAFELKLLDELGMQPDLEQTRLNEGTVQLVRKLQVAEWSELERLKPSAAQTKELKHFLHGFLIFHLGRIPAGRESALAGF